MANGQRRVLVLHPQSPWPTVTGSRQRLVALLDAVQATGATVILACRDEVATRKGLDVETYVPTAPTLRDRIRDRFMDPERLDAAFFVTGGMRRWVRAMLTRHRPHAVIVAHAWWASILPARLGVPTLIDPTDLVTLNRRLWRALEGAIGTQRPLDPATVPAAALDPRGVADGAHADPLEFRLYDRYDVTLAISEAERATIAARVRHTHVEFAPVAFPPVARTGSRRSGALFVMGDNPFNHLGYAWFARAVLPHLRASAPDLQISVVGSGSTQVRAVDGVSIAGPVDDLAPLYRRAQFVISPVLCGTGSELKVAEAMAFGVAPVVTSVGATRSGVVDDNTGLVAATPEAFAHAMVRLHTDAALAQRLGDNAKIESDRRYADGALQRVVAEFLATAQTEPAAH